MEPMSEQPNPRENDPNELFAQMMRQLGLTPGPDGQVDLAALLGKLQQQMAAFGMGSSTQGSGVNWQQTKNLTRQVTASLGADPTPTQAQQRQVAEATRLAELWLDQACDFGQVTADAAAWSRAEWVENSMQAWQQVCEPVVDQLATAMSGLLGQGQQLPPELGAIGGMLAPMMRQAAGTMYAMQLAQAIGKLSTRVVTGSEIGFQLLATPRVAVLPTNLAALLEGVEAGQDDLLLHLVLREAARQRLFNQVAWLGPQLLALVEHYAREISIDANALEEVVDVDDMAQMTPEKMAEISERLQGRLFEPTKTAEQVEVLGRLETLVALVEGWVDEVVAQAAGRFMPNHAALAESVRRRRAANGPAEEALEALLGLELRPRRIRDAANLWAALGVDRGIGGRDAVWHHPDMMPTTADLDDPLGYVSGDSRTPVVDDLDAELAKLLEEHGRNEGDEGDQASGSTPS